MTLLPTLLLIASVWCAAFAIGLMYLDVTRKMDVIRRRMP